MTAFNEILNSIHSGAVDGQISLLFDALRDRQKTVRKISEAQNVATLKPGTAIVLDGLSPKYLNGLTGTVASIQGTTVGIKLDQKLYQGKFWGTETLRVPASCVHPTEE